MNTTDNNDITVNRIGFYSSLLLSVITFITFGLAMTAIPNSGAFCPDNCFKYPYLDTLSEFPKDYLWMYFATFLILTYLVYILSIHYHAPVKNKIYTHISLLFAAISGIVLLVCYFTQFSVIPASLLSDETKGITLLTQYNPHGVFIAMEELGYLMMSFSFLFLPPAFTGNNRLEKTIRWIFMIAFVVSVISFTIISIKHGVLRKDRFEVIVISINWLVLITNGILTSIVFKRTFKKVKTT